MSPDEQIIRQWVRLAEHDLRQAEQTLAEVLDPAYEISCFHAQQAAEKYLKALLAANNLLNTQHSRPGSTGTAVSGDVPDCRVRG